MWWPKRFRACAEHLLFMSDLILCLGIDGVLHMDLWMHHSTPALGTYWPAPSGQKLSFGTSA